MIILRLDLDFEWKNNVESIATARLFEEGDADSENAWDFLTHSFFRHQLYTGEQTMHIRYNIKKPKTRQDNHDDKAMNLWKKAIYQKYMEDTESHTPHYAPDPGLFMKKIFPQVRAEFEKKVCPC